MINVHDLVEFKRGFRRPWEPGYVEQVERYAIHVRAALGSRADLVVIQLAGKDRRGKVRELSSERAAAVIATIRASIKPQVTLSDLPMLRVVRTDRGALREVPKARPRYLAPAFLAFVRTWKCCGCDLQRGPTEAHHVGARGVRQKADDYGAVPVCRPCHHLVTDRGILPGYTEAETARRFSEVSQMLLIEWAARADRLVSMPVLRIVAACLAVLVGLAGDYSGVKSARAAGAGSAQGMPWDAARAALAQGQIEPRPVGGKGLQRPAVRDKQEREQSPEAAGGLGGHGSATVGTGFQHRYTFGVGALPAAHAWRTLNASGRKQPGSSLGSCGQDTDSSSLSFPGVPRCYGSRQGGPSLPSCLLSRRPAGAVKPASCVDGLLLVGRSQAPPFCRRMRLGLSLPLAQVDATTKDGADLSHSPCMAVLRLQTRRGCPIMAGGDAKCASSKRVLSQREHHGSPKPGRDYALAGETQLSSFPSAAQTSNRHGKFRALIASFLSFPASNGWRQERRLSSFVASSPKNLVCVIITVYCAQAGVAHA